MNTVVNMRGEPCEALLESNPTYVWLQRVRVLRNGTRYGKLAGRTMPHIDRETRRAAIPTWGILFDGDERITWGFKDEEIYDA